MNVGQSNFSQQSVESETDKINSQQQQQQQDITSGIRSDTVSKTTSSETGQLDSFVPMDSFNNSVLDHLGVNAGSTSEFVFDSRAHLSERGSDGLYVVKGPDQQSHAFFKQNGSVLHKTCKEGDTESSLISQFRSELQILPGKASVSTTNSSRTRIDKALHNAEPKRSGNVKGGSSMQRADGFLKGAESKKSKGFFASMWSRISTPKKNKSGVAEAKAVDAKQKQILKSAVKGPSETQGQDVPSLDEHSSHADPVQSSTTPTSVKKIKTMSLDEIKENIQGQKDNLSEISVKHKNLSKTDPARKEFRKDCQNQIKENKKILARLDKLQKSAKTDTKKSDIKQSKNELRAMNSVLTGIATGKRKSTLNSQKQRVLEIIRPFAEANTSAGNKLTMDALTNLAKETKNFDLSDIQDLFDEISLESLASPDPQKLNASFLNGALAKVLKSDLKYGISVEDRINNSPLKDVNKELDLKFQSSRRARAESLENNMKQYDKAVANMEQLLDDVSGVCEINNPKSELQEAVKKAERDLGNAETKDDQSEVYDTLTADIQKILYKFLSDLDEKIKSSDPEFDRLRSDQADKKEGAMVALSKYRMQPGTPIDTMMKKIKEKVPAFAGSAFANQPQMSGLEKLLSIISDDTTKGSIPDALKNRERAKAKMN